MSTATVTERTAQLNSRLRDWHGVGIEHVLELVAYLRKRQDTVIAGGSLAIGLGNRQSDLDIVIVGEETIESSRVPLEHFVASLRVDVWVMAKALIDEVFARAERGLAMPGRLDVLFANVDDEVNLKLLHRVAFGLTLDGSPLKPTCTRDHAEIAREAVVREYAERMREHAFLAQLAADQGRMLNATINARDAIEQALHATITAQGVPFTGHKWLGERLRANSGGLAATYEPFATLPDEGEDWQSYVAAAIERCEELSGVTLAPAMLATQCTWVNDDLAISEVADTKMLLSVKAGGLWELEPSEAASWAALTSGLERQQGAEWPCAQLEPSQAALCFSLYESGLISLRWSEGLPDVSLTMTGRAE